MEGSLSKQPSLKILLFFLLLLFCLALKKIIGVITQKRSKLKAVGASWLKTGSCPECLSRHVGHAARTLKASSEDVPSAMKWISLSLFFFFNEVEGCLSQISVYPACLLPDACQTWFVSLEFFCPRFEQVVVVGRRHCPVPYLLRPFVSEPRGVGCIKHCVLH